MAYSKETISTVKLIRFYYPTEDVFKQASMITAFKGSSIRTPDGQPDFNRVHIADDEKIYLKTDLGKGILEIFSVMFKMLGEESIFINSAIDPLETGTTFEASGGFIKDNETGYRAINLQLLDSKIFDALIDYVLQRWYWLKNMPDDSAMHQKRFTDLLVQINDLTLNLRKPY